MQVFLLSSAV